MHQIILSFNDLNANLVRSPSAPHKFPTPHLQIKMAPITIGDNYAVLPISIPPTSAYPQSVVHHIYLRPHAPKIPTDSDSRSLFLVNVPIDSTAAHFRAIFSELLGAGRFEGITFEGEKDESTISQGLEVAGNRSGAKKRKRRGDDSVAGSVDTALPATWARELRTKGRTAIVVLVDEKAVDGALKAVRKLGKAGKSCPIWGEGVSGKKDAALLGSARYAEHQRLRYPDRETLQGAVDRFMADWGAREEEAERERKRVRSVPDEDGFVTVTRGGRVGPARKEEVERKRVEMEEREQRKRGEMEAAGFYRFQGRERRKEEQGELVRRFEEDRRRVEEMREKRGRFRPES